MTVQRSWPRAMQTANLVVAPCVALSFEPPQGRKAARIRTLWRVRGESFTFVPATGQDEKVV